MDRDLASRRCTNHWQREAVARCPECARFFCRECVTEHDDRILCASCLKKQGEVATRNTVRIGFIFRAAQMLVGIFLVWIFFYYVGQALLLMPDSFHEGSVWGEED